MVESAGAYGIWFEWGRAKAKSKEEVEPDLKLLAYRKECGRIFWLFEIPEMQFY